MTTTYQIHARCVRSFSSWIEIEADTPEEALAAAKRQDSDLIAAAQDSESWPWDEFAAYDRHGRELLRVLDTEARLRDAAPAQSIVLDLLQHGLATIGAGELEFDGVMYWFDDQCSDWVALVDAIGWEHARAAIAKAKGGAQ